MKLLHGIIKYCIQYATYNISAKMQVSIVPHDIITIWCYSIVDTYHINIYASIVSLDIVNIILYSVTKTCMI